MPFNSIYVSFQTPLLTPSLSTSSQSAWVNGRPTQYNSSETPRRPRSIPLTCCSSEENVDNDNKGEKPASSTSYSTPGDLSRAWSEARVRSNLIDVKTRHVSVLCVSMNCERALFASRLFEHHAQMRSRSRRLLVHSAGINTAPGASLRPALLRFAAEISLPIPETKPCARFDGLYDFEFYDYILAIDEDTRDYLRLLAAKYAREHGGALAEWERKIRVISNPDTYHSMNFDTRYNNNIGYTTMSTTSSTNWNYGKIPEFRNSDEFALTIERLNSACQHCVDCLIASGL